MRRLTSRVVAVFGAAIVVAALASAFVSGETEPIVRDIDLDGVIEPSATDPPPTTDGAHTPSVVPEIEQIVQIEPAPAPQPATPPLSDPVVAPPAITFIPPADAATDDPAEADDPGSGGDDPDD